MLEKNLKHFLLCSHLSFSQSEEKISQDYLFLHSDAGLTFSDAGLVKCKVPGTGNSGFLLHYPITWMLIAFKNSFPRLGRWVQIILLGALTSESMIIMIISICIPLSLHSAYAGECPHLIPATHGEGFVFWASHWVWHTRLLLIQCLLLEEGRQTTETGFPKASQLVRADKHT